MIFKVKTVLTVIFTLSQKSHVVFIEPSIVIDVFGHFAAS